MKKYFQLGIRRFFHPDGDYSFIDESNGRVINPIVKNYNDTLDPAHLIFWKEDVKDYLYMLTETKYLKSS